MHTPMAMILINLRWKCSCAALLDCPSLHCSAAHPKQYIPLLLQEHQHTTPSASIDSCCCKTQHTTVEWCEPQVCQGCTPLLCVDKDARTCSANTMLKHGQSSRQCSLNILVLCAPCISLAARKALSNNRHTAQLTADNTPALQQEHVATRVSISAAVAEQTALHIGTDGCSNVLLHSSLPANLTTLVATHYCRCYHLPSKVMLRDDCAKCEKGPFRAWCRCRWQLCAPPLV